MLTRSDDGSLIDDDGRVVYFSVERFISDICEGECCFLCGVAPGTETFSNEHIIPDWVLRQFGLKDRRLGLPNDSNFQYKNYVIRCCETCNNKMGVEIEKPISTLVAKGHAAINDHLAKNGPWLFFIWLNLIFLKTHLKDRSFRLHQDRRKQGGHIADHYTWEEFHHIHCVARSFFAKAHLEPTALGSLLVLPAKHIDGFEDFDYRDLYEAKTVLLRLGETAFICVLTDSCAVWNVLMGILRRISGPVSPLQLRELMAHAASVYLHLKHQPQFSSTFDLEKEYQIIRGDHSEKVAMNNIDPSVFGAILESGCGEILDILEPIRTQEIRGFMREGRWTCLFDRSGRFIRNSMEPIDGEASNEKVKGDILLDR